MHSVSNVPFRGKGNHVADFNILAQKFKSTRLLVKMYNSNLTVNSSVDREHPSPRPRGPRSVLCSVNKYLF